MRNALLARDPAGMAAAEAVFAARGTIADALLAAALAGAARGSEASLLGSLAVLLVGPGVGAVLVDGRARAPGVGARRGTVPEAPPASWAAVLPGFLHGVFTAHTRFGALKLAEVTHQAATAVRAVDRDGAVRARLRFLESLGHEGPSGLERRAFAKAMKRAAGVTEGGLFTERDLRPPPPARVLDLEPARTCEGLEVLQPPWEPPPVQQVAHLPKEPPAVAVEVAVGMDHRGVVGCACWAVAPTAVPLPDFEGLALAALLALPHKGMIRWPPGAAVMLPRPLAVLRSQGRAWAALGVAGRAPTFADLERARDAVVATRLGLAGAPVPSGPAYTVHDAVSLWAVRQDEGLDVRTSAVAL